MSSPAGLFRSERLIYRPIENKPEHVDFFYNNVFKDPEAAVLLTCATTPWTREMCVLEIPSIPPGVLSPSSLTATLAARVEKDVAAKADPAVYHVAMLICIPDPSAPESAGQDAAQVRPQYWEQPVIPVGYVALLNEQGGMERHRGMLTLCVTRPYVCRGYGKESA